MNWKNQAFPRLTTCCPSSASYMVHNLSFMLNLLLTLAAKFILACKTTEEYLQQVLNFSQFIYVIWLLQQY